MYPQINIGLSCMSLIPIPPPDLSIKTKLNIDRTISIKGFVLFN